MLILILTLATEQATLRMRVWRTLKATGAAVLRDGVYLMPDNPAGKETFNRIAQDVRAGGGTAFVMLADEPEGMDFSTLFDRAEDYAGLLTGIRKTRSVLTKETALTQLKQIRNLRKSFIKIATIDFFPSDAQVQTESALTELELLVNRLISPDEPHTTTGALEALSVRQFKNRVWATRRRPWVDRLASAWLILRFIDTEARFIWLDDIASCPRDAVGFDFDGAMFSHVDTRVTFEVLLKRFELENNALTQLGLLVHYLDTGGVQPPEAAGVESILTGLRESITDDDKLLETASTLFDSLLITYQIGSEHHE
ncbi:TPA: chromate resistance protein [Klebsiella pneumoniae]|nr:chromate resistance protein [Klebsiella pneumoniae]HDZ0843216.1 chromate resistance protein [Klebsiella pneumoniae]